MKSLPLLVGNGTPYVTAAAQDYEDVRIVMSDTVHTDNVGEVVYRAAIR
jgi:hypothetical protein